MTKVGFHTYDAFEDEDWFDICYKEALKSGLACRCFCEERPIKLELWGMRSQFLRYYLKTMPYTRNKFNGVIRFISFLFA